jgi:hypothetical protein
VRHASHTIHLNATTSNVPIKTNFASSIAFMRRNSEKMEGAAMDNVPLLIDRRADRRFRLKMNYYARL